MQPDLRGHILKKAAVYLGIMAVFSVLLMYFIPVAEDTFAKKKEEILTAQNREREKLLSMSGIELIDYANDTVEDVSVKEQTLRFDLPLGCKGESVKVEHNLREEICTISFKYADENYFLDRTVTGDTSVLSDVNYEYADKVGTLTLRMSDMYECFTDYDEEAFYLTFKKPTEIYDKIVFIDAGNGGDDTGVEKYNIDEKNINLDICLKLKDLLKDVEDTGFYFSRLGDETLSEEEREAYAKGVGADIIISVRMNHTPSGMLSTINGTSVSYNEVGDSTQTIAETLKTSIIESLGTSDKGVHTLDDDDGWEDMDIPVLVIKPGFMNNTGDLEIMSTEEARVNVANAIFSVLGDYLAGNFDASEESQE